MGQSRCVCREILANRGCGDFEGSSVSIGAHVFRVRAVGVGRMMDDATPARRRTASTHGSRGAAMATTDFRSPTDRVRRRAGASGVPCEFQHGCDTHSTRRGTPDAPNAVEPKKEGSVWIGRASRSPHDAGRCARPLLTQHHSDVVENEQPIDKERLTMRWAGRQVGDRMCASCGELPPLRRSLDC